MSIAAQVSSALQEMHRYGIVHCDIKCHNILYEFTSQLQVCITDFGVSQVKLGAEKVSMRRNVRLPALSVSFAAPEVLAGIDELRNAPKVVTEVNLDESRNFVSIHEV